MVYNIAICDDNSTDTECIEAFVRVWAERTKNSVKIDKFASAEEFLFHYSEKKTFDLLLLDIEMKAMSGVELAKMIRRENESVEIIFITGYSDYIIEGYEVSALHYLIKPLDREKLFAVLDKAADKIRRNERALLLELPDRIVRIPINEIRYIDANANYADIHAAEVYTVRRTLRELERDLDERFYRTGRSCIVNLTYIRSVSKKDICLFDGTSIPLPRGVYTALNRAIIERL